MEDTMYKKSLLILSTMIFFCSPKFIISQEYEQQFWLESKYALSDSFQIKVSLPPGYFDTDTAYYPVLYMTDADAFWGAVTDYAQFMSWDNNPIIIVGIAYGGFSEGWHPEWKRRADLYPLPNNEGIIGAKRFLRFFQEELIINVESRLRIDSTNRTLFGWSRGGMFATFTLFQQPELFRNYLILGTPFISRNKRYAYELEEKYSRERQDLPVRIYMGVGEYDATAFPTFNEFVRTLQRRNYEGLQLQWEVFKDIRHEYKAPVLLLTNGLKYFFQGTLIYTVMLKMIKEHGVTKAIAEYHRLKKMAPGDYNFREDQLNNVGYFLLKLNRVDEAIKIFQLNVEVYPESWNVYDSLGEAYLIKEDTLKAIENYKLALKMSPENEHEYIRAQLKVLGEK
jgi:predicted alpha/beta superfamily hydrolase